MPVFGKISVKASTFLWGSSHSPKKNRTQEVNSKSTASEGEDKSPDKFQGSNTPKLKSSKSKIVRSAQTALSSKGSFNSSNAQRIMDGSSAHISYSTPQLQRSNENLRKSDTKSNNLTPSPQRVGNDIYALPQDANDNTQKSWKSEGSRKTTHGDNRKNEGLPVTPKLRNNNKSDEGFLEEGMSQLSDFVLERTIGTGSFGRVHLARNVHNNKFYALKVLGKAQIVEMNQVDHALNEKRIIRQLSNPFLVHCYSFFHDPQNLYFVLEYVYGGELFSYLRQSGRFENKVAQFYSSEVVSAFEYMHNIQILYRDLKPENILINSDGHIKITDFGFAKYVPDVTWTLCGTPDYLAPEIIQSKAYGAAADWWSLGVFIYEMLAGYPPFYDENPINLYEKILVCKVAYSVNFIPEAIDLISKLLCLDLTKRYGNLRGGVNDIKNHPWYSGVDWERVKNLEVKPPYIPQVSSEDDTCYFSTYVERPTPYNPNCSDTYYKYFKEF